MTYYLICGLRVCSEIVLPGAIPEAACDAPDVTIRCGTVPETLAQAGASGSTWQMRDDLFLLRVPRVARFQIVAGREITLELERGATPRDASGFVLGTAFGILLHQRGALVLHGAAVAWKNSAVLICGASGAGKSTLAAALCSEGYSFVADDICVIDLNAERRPMVLPDGRQLKLWSASIDRLNLAARRGAAVRDSFEKYYIEPVDTGALPTPLSAIYVLHEARRPLDEGIEKAALPDAMRMLEQQAYRPAMRARLGVKTEHTGASRQCVRACRGISTDPAPRIRPPSSHGGNAAHPWRCAPRELIEEMCRHTVRR